MKNTVAIIPKRRAMVVARCYSPISHSVGPNSSYDVVVIGAGVCGLIAANLLAMQGVKVLLVEQHYVVGGYCSTFSRKHYTFDAASHFYPLLGDKSTMTGKLLEQIGCQYPGDLPSFKK